MNDGDSGSPIRGKLRSRRAKLTAPLPPDHDLDDEQIEKLRRQMHQLAEVIIDAALWDARKKREAAEAAAGDGSEREALSGADRPE